MSHVFRWENLDAVEHGLPSSRCRIQTITGKDLQLIRAEFESGGEYEMHSHPHEQFGIMIQGRMLLTVGEEVREVAPGAVWHVPPGVVHGGTLIGDEPVVFIDVFHPVREDVLAEMERRRSRRPPHTRDPEGPDAHS